MYRKLPKDPCEDCFKNNLTTDEIVAILTSNRLPDTFKQLCIDLSNQYNSQLYNQEQYIKLKEVMDSAEIPPTSQNNLMDCLIAYGFIKRPT